MKLHLQIEKDDSSNRNLKPNGILVVCVLCMQSNDSGLKENNEKGAKSVVLTCR